MSTDILATVETGPSIAVTLDLSVVNQGAAARDASYLAGEILGGHRVVVLAADGLLYHADPSDPAHIGRVVGLTTGAVEMGAAATVRVYGEIIEPGWAWDPDLPVFVGGNGLPTQTPPAAGFSQILGFAVSAVKLFIALEPPIIQEA